MKSTNVIDAYFKTQVIHANNMQIAARKKTFLPDTNLLRLDTRSAGERKEGKTKSGLIIRYFLMN